MSELFRTSLFNEHQKLGAKLVPFAGWEMPVQYTSVKDEVIAVRQNVGVFDVSHMGEFFVEGEDAEIFVDQLVTNDIASAPMGKAIYSPLCRENGTVVDDLIVYKLAPKKIMICVNASNIDKDFAWMQSQHKGFNCTLVNKSSDYSLLAVQGPKTEAIIKTIFKELPEMEYYSVKEMGQFILARTGYTGEDGFEVFGPHEQIKTLWGDLLKLGVTPCGLASRDVLRLEVCYPLYGHELTDEVTPLDAALGWTVKLNKKSFIGKNALTETKPKYKLIKLKVEKGIPREGYKVVNSEHQVVGTVTSGTMSVALNQGIAFAQVEIAKYPQDEVFFVDIRGKFYNTTLTKKAFVTGGHK